MTQTVRDILKDKYIFESRGAFEIKGKGKMNTFFLQGKNTKNRLDYRTAFAKKIPRGSQLIELDVEDPVERNGEMDLIKTLISGVKFVNRFTLSFMDPKKEPKFMHVCALNSR